MHECETFLFIGSPAAHEYFDSLLSKRGRRIGKRIDDTEEGALHVCEVGDTAGDDERLLFCGGCEAERHDFFCIEVCLLTRGAAAVLTVIGECFARTAEFRLISNHDGAATTGEEEEESAIRIEHLELERGGGRRGEGLDLCFGRMRTLSIHDVVLGPCAADKKLSGAVDKHGCVEQMYPVFHDERIYLEEGEEVLFERFEYRGKKTFRQTSLLRDRRYIFYIRDYIRRHLFGMLFDVDASFTCVQHADSLTHALERKVLLLRLLVREKWFEHELRKPFLLPSLYRPRQFGCGLIDSDEPLLHALLHALIDFCDPLPLRYDHLLAGV